MLARMARTGARPGDWKAEPLPERVGALAFKRSFSAAEFMRLQRGVVPEQMEDKWFVVWHDDALWLHRSWTALCIYVIRFAADGDHFVITGVTVNREPTQYTGTDSHDLVALDNLLDSVLSVSGRGR
jgi:8-oxo-dGTP diphosphatase